MSTEHGRFMRFSITLGILCGVLLMMNAGCDTYLGSLLGLPGSEKLTAEDLATHTILGGTAERTLMVRTTDPFSTAFYDLLPDFNPLNPGAYFEALQELGYAEDFEIDPPKTKIVAVNLNTLESEVLASDLPIDEYSLQTDGRWLAWVDYDWESPDSETKSIHVIDLNSKAKTESVLFEGMAGGRLHGIAAVSDGYLILTAGSAPSLDISLVVMNLETEETREIEQVYLVGWSYGYNGQGSSTIVVDGVLYMHVWPPTAGEIDLADVTPIRGRIDTVDLASGERATLIDDIDGGAEDCIYVFGDRLLIKTYAYNQAGTTTIRSYPLVGGAGTKLLEYANVDYMMGWSTVNDVNDIGVLIQTSNSEWVGLFNVLEHDTLVFRPYVGDAVPIKETSINTWDVTYNWSVGRLVDQYVVYRDAAGDDFVVVDVKKQTQRRFNPFE